MKKNRLLLLMLFTLGISISGQVGINTPNPHTSSDLELGSNNKALFLNRVANSSVIVNPQPGMLIYDLSQYCVRAYQGNPPAWSTCLGGAIGTVTSLTCLSATFNPSTATVGSVYSGTLTVPYMGGNGGTLTPQSFTNNGLTYTLAGGSLASGAGQVIYSISGTPLLAGISSVDIALGGQICTGLTGLTTNTATGTVATLSCTSATFSSNTATVGSVYSGTLTVPYTGGNGGAYPAQSFTNNGLTYTLSAGNFATGSGTVVYNIVGTPTAIGTSSVNVTLGGQTCTGLSGLTVGNAAGSVTSLTCASATFSPSTATVGSAYSGTLTLPYTGGNGGAYPAQSFTNNGLTYTLTAGSFATGSGQVVYTISGTPTATGASSVNITLGGQTCTALSGLNTGSAITIPTNIVLAQNKKYFVVSIYDQDYLPFVFPTAPATAMVPVAADGNNELVTADYQGTMTTAGVSVTIPITASGSGTLPAYSQTIVIPASLTQDGVSRSLTLAWTSQSYTSSTKFITATIKAVGGTLNAKKLDINAGIGNDIMGILLGQFTYPYNNTGNQTSFEVRDLPGIPDKMFGLADNNGSTTSHLMLYMPAQTNDGNVWINSNLGSEYSKILGTSFNPMQAPTSENDYKAFGSMFEWGRRPDGHELINWTSETVRTPLYPAVSGSVNNPTHPNYITADFSNSGDWRPTKDDTLWATETSSNNPCPQGFRVPTITEYNTYISKENITDAASAFSSSLKFVRAGYRDSNGNIQGLGGTGSNIYYLSSSPTTGSNSLRTVQDVFINTSIITYDYQRTFGSPVKCIKN